MPEELPILDGLLQRTAPRRVLCTALAERARAKDESDLLAFNGEDASSDLVVHLLDAMLAFERLRTELLTEWHSGNTRRGEIMPGILELEGALSASTEAALELHRDLWIEKKKSESRPSW